MPSGNSANKTLLYSYTAPNGSLVSLYNDGSEFVSNETLNPILFSGTSTITVTDGSFDSVTKKGSTTTTNYLGDTISLGNGAQTVIDTSHQDNVILSNNSGDSIDGRGASGNDSYFGGNGKDVLYAGAGNDYLDGGNGVDFLFAALSIQLSPTKRCWSAATAVMCWSAAVRQIFSSIVPPRNPRTSPATR